MTVDPHLHPAIHAPALELDNTEYQVHGPNVASLILAALERNQDCPLDKPALIRANHPDQVTTVDDLLNGSTRVAHALVSKYHVSKGDRIVILAPNHVRWPVAMLAGLSAGAVMVLVNPLLTPQEAVDQIKCAQGNVKAVVTIAAMAKLAEMIASEITTTSENGPTAVITLDTTSDSNSQISIDDLMAYENSSAVALPKVSPSDIAAVCYSSGTTGKNKAAALTHGNIASAMLQVAQHEYAAMHRPDDVMDAVLPWYHIFGLVVNLMQAIYLGTKVVLSADLRFDLLAWLQLVQEHKVTISHLVPPILVGIAKHPAVEQFDLSTLRSITVGACPLDAQLHAMVVRRFKNLRVCQGFGLTEASPAVSFLTYNESADPSTYGSVGSLVPSVYALLIATDTDLTVDSGSSIAPIATANTPGELLVSGPNVIPGYIGDDQANATTFVEWQGRRWLRTGDVAIIRNDGRFVVVDRIKELIKYNGYQVAPAELEAMLITHPNVAQAAVVGKPDQEHGELPAAFVALKPGVDMDLGTDVIANEIRTFVDAQVAPYRRLRGGVTVVDAIPVSPTGKILRRVLKAQLQ